MTSETFSRRLQSLSGQLEKIAEDEASDTTGAVAMAPPTASLQPADALTQLVQLAKDMRIRIIIEPM